VKENIWKYLNLARTNISILGKADEIIQDCFKAPYFINIYCKEDIFNSLS
jgi:hypothetical protein